MNTEMTAPPYAVKVISDLAAEIAERRKEIDQLLDGQAALTELYGLAPAEETSRPERPPAKAVQTGGRKKQANPPPVAPAGETRGPTADEKPNTVGGAMKYLLRQGPITREELREKLQADPDFKKLIDAAGASTLASNLNYWLKTEKIKEDGEKLVNVEF